MFSIFRVDAYLPMTAISLEESGNLFWNNRDHRRILAFGRLKPGISLREAQSSLDVITARLANQYPASDRWFTVRAVPERSVRPIPYANTTFVAVAGMFLALPGFVFAAGLHERGEHPARSQRRETARDGNSCRGAGRTRLVFQSLTESLLLGIPGGGAGLAFGAWANWLSSIHFQSVPLQFDATLDGRVFTFGAASVFATVILVGLLPALRASSMDVNSLLHDGARRESPVRSSPSSRRAGHRTSGGFARAAGCRRTLTSQPDQSSGI
jgi:putative ABC transport system permease protein